MVKKKENVDNEDLWNKITKTVNPIKSDKILPTNFVTVQKTDAGNNAKNKEKIEQVSLEKSRSVDHQTVKNFQHIPSDLRKEEAFGIDAISSKKLRTGKFEIDATLDLHGMTQQSAFTALINFIKKSVFNKHRTILIITGKGLGGKGVLKNQLPQWLKTEICSPHILAFVQAQAKDGGEGAFYVRLRRDRCSRS